MILKLTNVGRLETSEVQINGLTVICGDNNTGKSTIGKVLYCIYNAFYLIEQNIVNEKEYLVRQHLQNLSQSWRFRLPTALEDMIKQLLLMDSPDLKAVTELVGNILAHYSDFETESTRTGITKEIYRILSVDKEEVLHTFLNRYLETEFGGHLGNVNHPRKKTTVELDIKDRRILFHSVGDNGNATIDEYISLNKRIIYMDDPFALDHANDFYYRLFASTSFGHSYQIGTIIRRNKLLGEKGNAIEEILRNKKLESIITKIREISDGEIVAEDGELKYRHSNLRKSLAMGSLSTGLKTFLMLKELLLSGALEENGIMVIDEPEVHLHPEWQIKLAELIVMLQSAYGLNIVLTTHSMEFISAIVTFSKQYGIQDSCDYYLTSLTEPSDKDGFPLAKLTRMNDDIQGLYASVSEPFEKLYQKMTTEV